jgi:hypothetical protein
MTQVAITAEEDMNLSNQVKRIPAKISPSLTDK